MKFAKTNIALAVGCMMLLGACATKIEKANEKQVNASFVEIEKVSGQISASQPKETIRGGRENGDRLAAEQKAPVLVKKTRQAWLGNTMVPVTDEDNLPAVFAEDFVFNFSDGGRPITLGVMASRLSSIVGVPVRVQPDVYSAAEPSEATGSTNIPAVPSVLGDSSGELVSASEKLRAGVPVLPPSRTVAFSPRSIQMTWNGSLAGFLNDVTDRLGLAWEYRDNTIVIMRFVTEYYELALFPNGYDYELSAGSRGQEQGESVNSTSGLSVKESGKLKPFEKTLEIVKEIVKSVPGSEVIFADGSGKVMVKTSREAQAQVRDFIKNENTSMLRQAHIQIDIYSVRTNQDNEFGVNMSAVYTAITGKEQGLLSSPATLTGALAGAISYSFFEDSDAIIPRNDPNTGNPLPTTNRRTNTAIINALNEMGSSVQYRPISLVAMNRQWARKSRLNTTSYLSRTTPSTGGALGGGSGLPGLETDEFITGDQYIAMPYILENNTILLKFGINLSDLISLVDQTTGDGATLQKVQTPNISSINDQYTVSLRPGEVMAITGLSREVASDTERRFGEDVPIFLGGSDKRGRLKEHFIVFVRGVVL